MRSLPHLLPLQVELGETTAQLTTAASISPETEGARQTLMSDLIQTGLWGLGLLIAAFIVYKIVRRVFLGAVHGDEFSALTLKQLHERGAITDEEYRAIRHTMAERMAAQLEEEKRRSAEAARKTDPVAARLAREALDRSPESPPPPPPPPPPLPRP
jgi:hypothetical protein